MLVPIVLAMLYWGEARGQNDGENDAEAAVEDTSEVATVAPRVREVGPSTRYVRDEQGQLVPVLNLTLTELHRLYELDLQRGEAVTQLPSYTFQDLSIEGVLEDSQAHLSVVATIRPLTDDWVRVPLLMGGSVLRESPVWEGDSEGLIVRDSGEGGYVAWLRGDAEQACRVTLEIKVAVEQVGNEMRLDLEVPRATSSQLHFTVPMARARATVSNGLLEERGEEDRSDFLVSGLAGSFRLAWRRADSRAASPRPLLEAAFEQQVKVDGLRQVTADVRMRVSSLRGDFDTFTVRLPEGARLFPRQFSQSGLQLTELPDPDEEGSRKVQVKLDRATSTPVEVQLLLEYPPISNGRGAEYDLGGLDVEEAIRQSGTIDFVVLGDWSLAWKTTTGLQRTMVPESLRANVAARFELTRRSYSLRMQVAARETQISVEPTYRIHVHSRRIRLEATFKYRLRGTSLHGLNIGLPGWQVTQIAPAAVVDIDLWDRDEVDPMVVPLTSAALTEDGELTLEVSAIQELDDPRDGLAITLPRPEAKTLAPATVVVLPADNIELSVSEEDSRGLEREPFPPRLELPEGQQRPLVFRELPDIGGSQLVAGVEIRERSVSISGTADVRLDAQTIRVDQRFQYRVAYEPLRTLDFVLPRQLLETGDLRFLYDQQALPMIRLNGQAEVEEEPARWVHVQVDPLTELTGMHEITVQHTRPLTDLWPGREMGVDVPLVQPRAKEGTIITGNHLHIQGTSDISFRLDDERWEEGAPGEPSDGLLLGADATLPDVTLQVSRRDQRHQTSTVVLQAWIDTRLGASIRRERAAFRVTTNQGHVAVRLPEGAQLERVGLNGQEVTDYAVRDVQTKVVNVPSGDEHVLELWYEAPRTSGPLSRLDLDVPQVVEARSNQRVFWTLATAPDVHLLLPPAEVTPVLSWTWRRFFWVRTARLLPQDLERWIGATPQPGDIPEAANRYLFSSFGPLGQLRFNLATRGTILLTMSGVALLIGLLVIYLSWLRHPATLFAGSLAVFTIILWYPDLALALLQAAIWGLLLTMLAVALRWYFDRHRLQGTVIRGTTYASPDSQTVKAAPALPEQPAVTSTATGSLGLGVAESRA